MLHFLDIRDYETDALLSILERCQFYKGRRQMGIYDTSMANKTLVMYFEKASLRTRVAQEVAAQSLGAATVLLEANGPGTFWKRESIHDQAMVVSRMADLISLRTYSHETIVEFAKYSRVPVVNTLSGNSHPTQALADIFTLWEHFGKMEGLTLTFCGDGNNVARSLMEICIRLGMRFIHTGPNAEKYMLSKDDWAWAQQESKKSGAGKAFYCDDPEEAASEADCLYTDVWTSMGYESEKEERRQAFAPYAVNERLLSHAPKHAVALHCLPAVRGEEITDEVMDHPERSLVFVQAENRMHTYRGLYPWLLEKKEYGIDK